MPRPVLDALTDHLTREAAIGGYEAADEAEPRVRETYALVARLVGAAPRNIALVENATVAFSRPCPRSTSAPVTGSSRRAPTILRTS